jgi:hypothetical protein
MCDRGLNTRKTDLQACSEEEAFVNGTEFNLCIDVSFVGKRDVPLPCLKTDRTKEAGRPPGCKALLWVGTRCEWDWR